MAVPFQRGSYGVNGGNSGFRTIWTVQYSTLSSTQRGLTGCGGGARIAEVKDGTANTVAALEIRSGLTASDVRGVWAYPPGSTVWGPGGINNGTDEYQDCTTQPAIGMPCITANNNAGLQVSRSEHRGGVHALMIDGAVRFLNQTISGTVYDNLRAIRDGNVVGEF